ncbi:WG repeat-containing protein [Psychrobacter sp. CCUG 69069]|uniref:WG repeat-containing protein n=1 Tax=Psychrobacter namhaensis TaxID=292734 RepID=A0ABW8L5N6_9GAMM|nr:WG repeat-containing protein [Psychrobacter sp. CCUG 69069]MCD1279647.1 WG repeat-containing protein [Psychrobacter sp. CCUG 69069]
MSEDIQDEIISAQIIDASGKRLIASESPIRKLLYHQLYTYKQAGKYGLLNDQGDVVLKPQFDSYRDEGEQVRFEENGKLIPLERLLD